MLADAKFKAVVHIEDRKDEHNDLKKLALFFDEIQYILPAVDVVKDEIFNDPSRTQIGEDGSKTLLNYDFYQDTHPGGICTEIKSLKNKQLQEVLYTFQDNGIAKEATTIPEDDEQFKNIANILFYLDTSDKTFNDLSDTKIDALLNVKVNVWTIKFGSGELVDFLVLESTNSMKDSYQTSAILYLSHKTSSFPVFLNPRHQREMEYRYAQYQKGLEILKDISYGAISPGDLKARFGEITFNVANSLFTSDLISNKTPKQIIKYRNAMSEARRRYLSEDLMEIASIAQDNP